MGRIIGDGGTFPDKWLILLCCLNIRVKGRQKDHDGGSPTISPAQVPESEAMSACWQMGRALPALSTIRFLAHGAPPVLVWGLSGLPPKSLKNHSPFIPARTVMLGYRLLVCPVEQGQPAGDTERLRTIALESRPQPSSNGSSPHPNRLRTMKSKRCALVSGLQQGSPAPICASGSPALSKG